MRLIGRASTRSIRWLGLTAIVGGVLWIPYGVFEMLQPWGVDTVYREDAGYELVANAALYRVYSLPGALALLFTSLGLLGVFALLRMPSSPAARTGLILAYIAILLSAISVVGVIVLFDPLFTAPRIFGSLALGIATFFAGMAAGRNRAGVGWTIALLILGLAGIFLLPLWPLVYAVQWMSEGVAAGFIALFGLGWLTMGYRLWSEAR